MPGTGGGACADVRWVCRDIGGCTERWASRTARVTGTTSVPKQGRRSGWLFLHIAPGGAACSPNAIEVCSQGFVLLTGTQLAGGAIAVAGIGALVIAIVRAVR